MATRNITVHDKCTAEGCGRTLYTVKEAERGVCNTCFLRLNPEQAKRDMDKWGRK